jgi:nicotinate phosphoribosyltransferase
VRDFEISRHILVGDTADIFLHRALGVLRSENINPEVAIEFAAEQDGVFCGIAEARQLLARVLPETGREVYALEEGGPVSRGDVALRIRAPYASFGLYETAVSGMLASCSGWATAARECVEAAQGTPVISFGARNVHPNVAAYMDYAAVIGGCVAGTTTMGGRLSGHNASGSMPHSLVMLTGDAVRAMTAFDRHMPPEVPRVALVDTFHDEAEEAVEVARSLKDRLRGVRVETPEERGGVTPGLVKEMRARLDHAGFQHVDIYAGGDVTPAHIRRFVEAKAPVAAFAVGKYISTAQPLTFDVEIKEIAGRPVARRGRIPGTTHNPRLERVL